MRFLFPLVLLSTVVCGCKVTPPPDPNDPTQVSLQQPKVMMRQLKWASDAANARVAKRELTSEQAKELVQKTAQELTQSIPIDKVPESEAWEYAEVYRSAKDYENAAKLLRIAIKNPQSEDRRINDTLRLAHCLAELGEVDEAIQLTRSTFDANPIETAPVLPAVLYEIVPGAIGKGNNSELAKLLLDAIEVYQKTEVDKDTDAGMAFLLARPHHIAKAKKLAQELTQKVSS
jgi:tetratricopeptide (TPR) repeat protein